MNEESFHIGDEPNFFPLVNILSRFKEVHTFIFDVDGVMTDNKILLTEDGAMLRSMNMRDGYSLHKAVNGGYRVFVITGSRSEGVNSRLRYLGVEDIAWGVTNKLGAYEKIIDTHGLDEAGILYMGDDMPDLEVMKRVGLATCPKDSVPEILQVAKYISPFKGGDGCVRDVVEKVLKLQNKW